MLYTCRHCQKSYSSYTEHADGLCLYCRNTLNGNDGAAWSEDDWREPLYQCVSSALIRWTVEQHEQIETMLIMLGDYRDCRKQLERVRIRLEREYDDCVRVVRGGPCASFMLENVLEKLRALNGRFDADALIETAQERLREQLAREAEERERAMRRERRKTRIRRALLTAACMAAAAFVMIQGYILIPEKLRQADTWMADGGYLMAYRLYSEAETLWHKEEARAGMERAQLCLADSQLEDGAYEAALELYRKYGQTEKEQETYRRWSEHLAAQGDAAGAIEKLIETPDSGERQARLAQLKLQRAYEAAKEALEREPFDAAYARELGTPIDTIDAQLRFCHALAEAGVDLFAVYPDGVEVSDVKTGRYRPETAQEQAALADTSRVLLFERREDSYLNPSNMLFGFDSKVHDVEDDSIYTVKLMAGELFAHPSMRAARTLEEATAIIFVDYLYAYRGEVGYWELTKSVQVRNMAMPPTMIYAKYPYFSSISSIAAYDARSPEQMVTGYEIVCDAPCSSLEWQAAYKDDKEAKSSLSNRIGRLEPEMLMAQMDDALARIMEQGNGGEADAD